MGENNELLKLSLSTRKIAFIHIGKAGGSTAGSMIRRKCTLPSNTKCQQYVSENRDKKFIPYETQISLQVKEYFHVRKPNIQKYNSFIVTVRHPLHRIVSWFLHNHPLNKITTRIPINDKVYNCFVQIDDLATNGLNTNTDNINNDKTNEHKCKIAARIFIHQHLKYKFYTQELLQPRYKSRKEIFVLRAEHFWNDWHNINTILGGDGKSIHKV